MTGVSYLSLIDSSRKELFDNEGKKYRELTIKVWYPADKKTKDELYLENTDMLITNFGFTEAYRNLKTNSTRDVAVSSAELSYPVLIYSHGWADDIKFFLNELERISKSDAIFKVKPDLNRIGVLGKSMIPFCLSVNWISPLW
jgi:predicted dienelactone hydrolase